VKKLLIFLTALMFAACQSPAEIDKESLGGYWQIEKVIMPDGQKRDFKVNPMVDFIEVQGDSGVRKKVVPQFDGSYRVNDSAERFVLELADDSLRMHYQTAFDRWTETVIQTGDSTLVILNQDGKTYHYKKFTTFSIK
jgi:hypothetical protein